MKEINFGTRDTFHSLSYGFINVTLNPSTICILDSVDSSCSIYFGFMIIIKNKTSCPPIYIPSHPVAWFLELLPHHSFIGKIICRISIGTGNFGTRASDRKWV